MSTTFAISRSVTQRDIPISNEEIEENFIIIGTNNGFNKVGTILNDILWKDIEVYAIDNSSKLRTLDDLRKYYKKHNKIKDEL